jgi:hypothetical protein
VTSRGRTIARLAAAIIGLAGLIVGCSLPPIGCDLSIGSVADPSRVTVGDPLPADVPILITPEDIDPLGGSVVNDAMGPSVMIKLRPEGTERFAAHTRANIGGALVVSIAGTVVAVPIVQSAIEDGVFQLTGGGDDAEWLQRFAGCVPTVIIGEP